MATRPVFTVDDVLREIDGNEEYEDDSEDEFDGYVEMDEIEDEWGAHVNANIEIGTAEMDSLSSDESDSDESDSVPVYTLEPGCSVPVEGDRPLDYLSLLVNNDILEHIVAQTNICAQQFVESHDFTPHSHVRRWSKNVHDVNELRRFLAIIIIMGLVRYPQIESQWSTMWPFTNFHYSSVSLCKDLRAHNIHNYQYYYDFTLLYYMYIYTYAHVPAITLCTRY